MASAGTDATDVRWEAETEPVPDGRDAADDPAIWVDAHDPTASLVLGTNKKGDRGLLMYDLTGREVGAYEGGAMNNVDLRTDVAYDGRSAVIVVASTVDGRSLEVLELDPEERTLVPIPGGSIDTGERSAGLCLWQPAGGGLVAFATEGNGTIQQWTLIDSGGVFAPVRARELGVDSRVEGCVADDSTGELFFAEEAVGIWRVSAAAPDGADPELIDEVAGASGLTADVEGMAIARYDDGRRYLVVSSQGSDRFIVYRLDGNEGVEPVGEFEVRGPEDVDDVEHTDGVEVAVGGFGTGPFERGLLVVQDDDNEQPDGDEENQNFKLVPWEAVEALLALE